MKLVVIYFLKQNFYDKEIRIRFHGVVSYS